MTAGAFATSKALALDFRPVMYMQEYLDEKEAQGLTASAIRGSRNGLHYFAEYLRTENIVSPEEITRHHLIRFHAWCNQKVTDGEWKKSYAAQTLKKVRAWMTWLEEIGYITSQPWVNLRIPKVDKQPKPLSDDDVELLFTAHRRDAFRIEPFTFHRREVMLCLLYGWGLRIHELEELTVDRMDQRNDFVTVINKGGGKKSLPYTPQIKAVVGRWLAQRARHAKHGQDTLLITASGEMLTKTYMYKIIVELGQQAGIRVNPHRLRDTFGTHMLDDDVPVERVQAIFGHSNTRQTLAYARVNDRKVFESLEKAMDPRLAILFHNTRDLRPLPGQ